MRRRRAEPGLGVSLEGCVSPAIGINRTPLGDLALVCPRCHRVIHRQPSGALRPVLVAGRVGSPALLEAHPVYVRS